jgi:hypothetical protein
MSPTRDLTKPLKSCLKKASTIPTACDLSESPHEKSNYRSRRSRRIPAASSTSNKPHTASSTERRERRRMRKLRSADSEVSPPSKPKRAPERSRSCEDIIKPLPVRREPLKSILKKSCTDPTMELPYIRKRVSWSDELNRWSSQGSGLNLHVLIAKTKEDAVLGKGNHKWRDFATSEVPKSKAEDIPALREILKKHQAPGKPQRKQSFDVKKGSPNPFASSVNDFQTDYSSMVRQMLVGPRRPVRQGSVELNLAAADGN